MNSGSKNVPERSDPLPQRLQDGTGYRGNKNAAAPQFEAVDGAPTLSGVIGVIRRLRRGRWTLTEVYG